MEMETLTNVINPPHFPIVAVKGHFCAQPTRGANYGDAATIVMVKDVVSLSVLSLM